MCSGNTNWNGHRDAVIMSKKWKMPETLEDLKGALIEENLKYAEGFPKRDRIRANKIINRIVELVGEEAYNEWLGAIFTVKLRDC